MLADEANAQKQKIREEQIKKWREHSDNYKPTCRPVRSGAITEKSVKFPQGCVYLAACSANDIDEVKHYLKMGVNINTTNIDGLTALHQVNFFQNVFKLSKNFKKNFLNLIFKYLFYLKK
jgi:protein phosphatase 1 regulatory subunit 12A